MGLGSVQGTAWGRCWELAAAAAEAEEGHAAGARTAEQVIVWFTSCLHVLCCEGSQALRNGLAQSELAANAHAVHSNLLEVMLALRAEAAFWESKNMRTCKFESMSPWLC